MASATVGALRVTLGLDSAQFTQGLNAAQRQLRSTGQRLQSVGSTMASVGAGMTAAISAPLVAVGISFSKAAIEAEEMQSAFNVSFGSMSADVRRWAETTGDAMGRSTFELQQMALGFNGLFKAGGPVTAMTATMSRQFTVLAQDLSSFHNVAQQDVFEALRSGLSGEAEPLRRFNVYLTEAAVKAEAMRLGLAAAGGELSEQAKIQARASLIMKGTVEAQGDVIRTSAGTQNQLRTLQSQWAELSVTLGQRILPVLTPIVASLNDMAKSFSGLSPQAQTFVLVAGGIAAVLGPLVIAAGATVAAVGALLPVIGAIGAPFLAAAAAVAAVGVAFWVFRDDILPVVQAFAAAVQENIGPKLAPLWEALKGAVGAVGQAFAAIFGEGSGGGATESIKMFGTIVARVLGASVDVITGALNVITSLLQAFEALLRGDFSAMWGFLGQAVGAAVRGIVNSFQTMFPEVVSFVRQTYEGVRTWLLDRFSALVRGIGEKVGQVTGFFRDMYIAVVGNSYVPDMVREIGDWMGGRLQQAMVNPALDAVGETTSAFGGMTTEISSQMDSLFRSLGSKDWKGVLGSVFGMLSGSGGMLGTIGRVGGAVLGGGGASLSSSIGEMVNVRGSGQGLKAGAGVSFDLRGAVMTSDLLQQMQGMAVQTGGAVFTASRSQIPTDLTRKQAYRTR